MKKINLKQTAKAIAKPFIATYKFIEKCILAIINFITAIFNHPVVKATMKLLSLIADTLVTMSKLIIAIDKFITAIKDIFDKPKKVEQTIFIF